MYLAHKLKNNDLYLKMIKKILKKNALKFKKKYYNLRMYKLKI